MLAIISSSFKSISTTFEDIPEVVPVFFAIEEEAFNLLISRRIGTGFDSSISDCLGAEETFCSFSPETSIGVVLNKEKETS